MRLRRLLIVGLLVVALTTAVVWWQRTGLVAEAGAQASLLPLPSEVETAGFARATEPDAMEFPEDLGPHESYQTEWWYYTGNLETPGGRRFGYQLTFFRRAIEPPEAEEAPLGGALAGDRVSDWRTNQIYLAHFALSDIGADTFYHSERFARGAAGIAGAQGVPYRVWLQDWEAEAVGAEQVRLYAETEAVTLDIILEQTLPPILHGDGGLSQKGPVPGNASYYYSLIQQETTGTVRVGAEDFAVAGLSWKDHEYSTNALAAGIVGWDWFSLQFDNGAALMFFQIRREDGTLQPQSSGTFIYPDGSTAHISPEEWELEVTDTWTSPETGAVYPAGWIIRIPSLDLVLEGRPLMADQELTVSIVYWEGAVAFEGSWQGVPVEATGYVELTGYLESMEGRF
ncbi:MAG: lipocalin-like domain-containing protein [Candidatus Promineifilaceae bacterium]|nr:lipocalin-like domain-containing protein [Candidatus Promineifilaceae bacterium]